MSTIFEETQKLFPYLQSIRRDLHQHPELGFQEVRTAGIVASELRKAGLEVSTGIAVTGVIGILEGNRPGPTILVRFDMDALPVKEATGADYASLTPGIMHACGHDGHVAIGLAVARLLGNYRDEIKGRVKFMFQPAEEGLGGAERMIAEGVLDRPACDYALALHLWNDQPVGWIGVSMDAVMAEADIFSVQIKGRGGHGATPNQAIDPVYAAAQIITAIQSIVSRNVSPLESAVVSVTQIHAGETFNVIPPVVEMKGTIRTCNKDVREKVMARFKKIVIEIAGGLDCQANVVIQPLTPAVVNNTGVAMMVIDAAQKTLPEVRIKENYRAMVSEDMAYVLEKIPGCYFLVGSANPERGLNYGHHHPQFDFDEAALVNAAAVMVGSILEILSGSGG